MRRRSFVLGGAALLSGCATSPALPLLVPTSLKKPCCTTLAEASYFAYYGTNVVRLGISDEAPTFNFKTGTSHFAGLELAADNRRRVLEVSTRAKGTFWLPAATLFVPMVTFLDSAFDALAVIEPTLYQNTGKLGDTAPHSYYGACVVPEKTRYVVISTDASQLATGSVRYVHAGGTAMRHDFNKVRERYQVVAPNEYAAGKVQAFIPKNGYAIKELRPRRTGELRVAISS